MKTGEEPRHVCPGDPYARKYPKDVKKIDINDPRLYEDGEYVHHLCMRDSYGFTDGEGHCTKGLGACLAQGENGACTCRDRAIKTLRMQMERQEEARTQQELTDIREGRFRRD